MNPHDRANIRMNHPGKPKKDMSTKVAMYRMKPVGITSGLKYIRSYFSQIVNKVIIKQNSSSVFSIAA